MLSVKYQIKCMKEINEPFQIETIIMTYDFLFEINDNSS